MNFVISNLIPFFKINPIFAAVVIAGSVCAGIMTEKINRAVLVVLGACSMIFFGIITQEQAIEGIDFNTLFLLIGMMIIVGITEKSGIFQYMAIWSAKKVRANPRGMLFVLALVTAFFSAFLDNVTTILLICPVAMLIAEKLQVRPYPYILASVFAANIGGAATLIGDPPNILIGSVANLSFMDFIRELPIVVAIVLFFVLLFCDLVWGRKLKATLRNRAKVMIFKEKDCITDSYLLRSSLFVLISVIIGFIVAEYYHIENGSVALFGAGILMLLYTAGKKKIARDEKIEKAFFGVDWTTIFFIAGLFVIVTGLEKVNLHIFIGNKIFELTNGSSLMITMFIIWSSTIMSGLIDNIPFVTIMLPVIQELGEKLGGNGDVTPLWWALSLGTCLGGNVTPIASSVNIVALTMAQHYHHPLSVKRFLLWSIPITFMSIFVASIYLYLRHFL